MAGMDADQFRAEWSTLTGRAPSDIYIPEAFENWDETQDETVELETFMKGLPHERTTTS